MNPITDTVDLGAIVTLSASELADSISTFWAIPLVGSILLLYLTLAFGPRVFRAVAGLMGRTEDPADDVHVTTTAVPGTKMFDLGDKGWIEDNVNMEFIDWHESTPDEGVELAREHGIYEGRIFYNEDGSKRFDPDDFSAV
jgi:hypothetical protein